MNQQRVLFRLEKDSDGYPPAEVESVWAERLADGNFLIDNIPFFTRQATLGDTVDVDLIDDELFFSSVVISSGNSLIRVALFNEYDPTRLRSQLVEMSCSSEQSHIDSLISINVPQFVDIENIRELLKFGCESGFWDYEEAILRH